MVKYYENITIFHFDWSQVVRGFFQRYPNPHRYVNHAITSYYSFEHRCYITSSIYQYVKNSYIICSSHVLTEDTISREVKNGKLHSKRLLTKTNRLPKWGERFISKNVVKIVEESIVDPEAKTLTTYTKNLGYTKVMVG